MREISKAESNVCRDLRSILATLPIDVTIEDSDERRRMLWSFEIFLPEVLREHYPEWENESLDGIWPAVARKTTDNEVEIIGICIFISDQMLTPLHLRLQVDSAEDAVSWMDLRLGESIASGLRKVPYSRAIVEEERSHVLERLGSITWAYKASIGEHRP